MIAIEPSGKRLTVLRILDLTHTRIPNIIMLTGSSSIPARFCLNCGTRLEVGELEHKQRAFCPRCGHIHYGQLKVGAGAIIERDGQLLLLQRTSEPFAWHWNLPAGYVEVDESPAQAVVREVYEETDLQVEVVALDDVYFFGDDPRGNGILIVYECHVIGGELSASTEGVNPTYFPRNRIPDKLAGGGHNQAVRAWQEHSRTGRNADEQLIDKQKRDK